MARTQRTSRALENSMILTEVVLRTESVSGEVVSMVTLMEMIKTTATTAVTQTIATLTSLMQVIQINTLMVMPNLVTTSNKGITPGRSPVEKAKEYNLNKRDLHRKQRGLMQWKPMRNLAFAKDHAKFMVRRTIRKASLSGRKPDVETEA